MQCKVGLMKNANISLQKSFKINNAIVVDYILYSVKAYLI